MIKTSLTPRSINKLVDIMNECTHISIGDQQQKEAIVNEKVSFSRVPASTFCWLAKKEGRKEGGTYQKRPERTFVSEHPPSHNANIKLV